MAHLTFPVTDAHIWNAISEVAQCKSMVIALEINIELYDFSKMRTFLFCTYVGLPLKNELA